MRLFNKYYLSILGLILLFSVSVVGSPMTLQLKSDKPEVETSQITLADLLDLSSLDKTTQQAFRNQVVAASYAPGNIQPIYDYQITKAIRNAGMQTETRLEGKFPIVVHLGKRLIAKPIIQSAVKEFFEKIRMEHPGTEFRWKVTRLPEMSAFPAEKATVRFDYSGRLRTGHIALRGKVTSGIYTTNILVPVELNLIRRVVIANRTMKRGEKIRSADLVLTSKSLNTQQAKYAFSDPEQLTGFVTRMDIQAGDVIVNHMIKKEELVSPGQDVKLKLALGNVVVSSLARALESGGKNDEIEVRDRRTGKVMKGIVVDHGIVAIKPVGLQ